MAAFDVCLEAVCNRLNIQFALKEQQIECIKTITDHSSRKDVIAILPTGYGKTLIYALLPPLFDALDEYNGRPAQHNCLLVVSPLIALMNDQVQRFSLMGLSAVRLTAEVLKAGLFIAFYSECAHYFN